MGPDWYLGDMGKFTELETRACMALIRLAHHEDLDEAGDLTTEAFISPDSTGAATMVARRPGVLAGLPAVALVLEAVDLRLTMACHCQDGNPLSSGTRIATIAGPMRSLLTAERTALNFLQRLSGVATQTRQFVDQVAGLRVQILDTRKTTPGWRLLEKYAVRKGGGTNHRLGLYDGILIKDNHLAALGAIADPVGTAVQRARERGQGRPVEIEVDTLEQFDRALACGPDLILLDNMTRDQMRECVRRRTAARSTIQLEASGGVSLQTVRDIALTGVERISVGALTHSATALDIGLDFAS